ncbi:SPW repeat domain-containing protein [Sphingobacterium thalpophilum]|uniref:SPW repeat domain-containing protein n=2 Tax=Sphingobacterium thalpophilum TaxID=259 RepID=UPI003DA474D1
MKIFSTRTHGYLDYLVGVFLILCPFLFHLANDRPEGAVFVVLGILTLVYSAITHYELGLVRIIPMNVHLVLDVLSGLFLAVSPWLFDFADIVYFPHVIIGIIEIGVALTTKTRSRGMV